MIIITGPGRSGTSVLAQFCLKMGYNPGGSWYESVDAGMEHPRVAAINDALLFELKQTGTVRKTLDAHREEMCSLDLTVVKDPRFTFHPEILRAWQAVRGDLKVLMTYRTPEHSVASRKRHGRNLIDKNKAHPDVLRCDFANGIEAMLDLDIPFAIVLFPNFLTRYEHVYEAFEMLGIHFDREAGREVWNTLVNLEKVHVRSATTGRVKTTIVQSRREARENLLARLPLRSIGLRPSIAAAFLVCLLFAPLGWKNLGATALPIDQNPQTHRRVMHHYTTFAAALAAPRIRHWAASAPYDAAFLRSLSLFSVRKLPFDAISMGRPLHHRVVRPLGRPAG